ncbi:MAG: hypothetical protein ACOCTI_03520 [Phycisphaeraceae bacterium]
MVANILIVFFLLGMIALWGKQGMFSSLMHLLTVIVAGALALALWEPLHFLLLGAGAWMAPWAKGVALLVPFALVVLVLRVLEDRWVASDIYIPNIPTMIGGSAFGLGAGILTAGLTVIGLGFLPLAPDIAGYEPYGFDATGDVEEVEGLWVPVDSWTADFYASLSSGALSPSFSEVALASHAPALRQQSALYRLRPDRHATVGLVPGSVEVTEVAMVEGAPEGAPEEMTNLLPEAPPTEAPRQLVLVKAAFSTEPAGTYDEDGTLRLPQPQVRLLAGEDGESELISPIGFTKVGGEQRHFYAYDSAETQATAVGPDDIVWVFSIPGDMAPRYLSLRTVRFDLPEAELAAEPVLAMLGMPAPAKEERGREKQGPTKVEQQDIIIEVSNDLPQDLNRVTASDSFELESETNAIISGRGTVSTEGSAGSAGNRVKQVYQPTQFAIVRMQVDPERAQSLAGAAISSAAKLSGAYLLPQGRDMLAPIGYVLVKEDEVVMRFGDEALDSARELPVSQMGDRDELYRYDRLPHDTKVTGYRIRGEEESIDLYVP